MSRNYVIKASNGIVGIDVRVPATLEERCIDVSGAGPSSMIINVGEGGYVKTAGPKLTSMMFAIHITGDVIIPPRGIGGSSTVGSLVARRGAECTKVVSRAAMWGAGCTVVKRLLNLLCPAL